MPRGCLITIGSFDGVHRGHSALLERTVLEAKKRRLPSLALTFNRPPKIVLEKTKAPSILTVPEEKEFLMRRIGITRFVSLDFDAHLAHLKAFSFFRDVLFKKYQAQGIVVGHDFRFGVHRSAGAFELVRWGQEYEIPVWVISPIQDGRQTVSSTRVRQVLDHSRFNTALRLLGHPYLIYGQVEKGRGIGKKLGFPTANLAVDKNKLLPSGVYAVKGWEYRERGARGRHRAPWPGVCNIGRRPTFARRSRVLVEAHFFGVKKPLYGKNILIQLESRIRSEKRFPCLENLKKQIAKDVKKGGQLLDCPNPGKKPEKINKTR